MKKKQIFLAILAAVLLIFALPKAIWYFQFKSVNIIKEEPVGAAEENAAQAKLTELGFENYMFDALRPADKIKLAQLADEGYTLTPYCDEIVGNDNFIQCFLAVKLEKDGEDDLVRCYGMRDEKEIPRVKAGDSLSIKTSERIFPTNYTSFLKAYRYNPNEKSWELYQEFGSNSFYKIFENEYIWFWERTNTLNRVYTCLEFRKSPNSDFTYSEFTFRHDYDQCCDTKDNSDITEITLTVDLT